MLRRSCSTVLGSIALCAALAVFAVPAFAQVCITGPETSCEPAELCAPEGYAAYYWAPPGGGVLTTRCITASVSGEYMVRFGSSPETLGEPCFFKFHIECGEPKDCEITGDRTVCEGDETELCGPEGYTYEWSGPGGFTATTRCITVGPGTYDLVATLGETKLECSATVTTRTEGCEKECEITGPREVCEGQEAQLCGPEGYTYEWTGPGGFTATTRCIVVGPGVYHLVATLGETKLECEAEVTEKKEGCTFNCPRTPGFWGSQCRPDENGSVKFNTSQMNSITACVDDKAAIFNWGASDFSNFCSIVNPTVSNQRTNAKKHFATFLANLCTDELNLIANNGDEILLDPSTEVTCDGSTTTIGALVGSIDAQLVALEGQSLALSSVKSAYSKIIGCLNAINNGDGIGPVCGEEQVLLGAAREGRSEATASEHGALELATPYPNPMTRTMRMTYAIQGAGSMVKIGVYDLAGRKVRELVSGVHAAGVYQTEWNALDASGSRVRSGVYFIRGTIGSQVTTRQVIVN